MNNNQRLIAKEMLQNKIVVQSWGITNIHLIEDGICFDVCGFKYKGLIEIRNNTNGCVIRLGSKQIAATIEDLVGILDDEIEVTINYASDLKRWLINNKK